MEGENERVLNPSVSPMEPNTVILVDFKLNQSVYIKWSNLNHRDYSCTKELIDVIQSDLSNHKLSVPKSSINQDRGTNIAYQTFSDTLWSCDEALVAAYGKYYTLYREADGVLKEEDGYYSTRFNEKPAWSTEKPLCYGKRNKISSDNEKYTMCKDGKCYDPSEDPEAFFPTYCEENGRFCWEHVPGFKYKADNIGYWQVHLYPEVVYFCRNPENGQPITDDPDCPPMNMAQMIKMKKQALEKTNDIRLRKFRKPFLSDSASSIISFSFVGGKELKNRDFIWLSSTLSGCLLKVPDQKLFTTITRVVCGK
jgi:hypothetical protein